MSAPATVDFADPGAVRALVPGSGQRLVRLSFPDGTQFYSHPVALALGSGVLRNVLEDTQAQQHPHQQQKKQKAAHECTTIPLDDGPDTHASWQIALALMHNQQADEVTMDHAQTLLLLADKYEMPCITVPVREFLMFTQPGAIRSRLAQQLKPETVVGWLTAASRCGLQQAVQMCTDGIDVIVGRQLSVSFTDLSGLSRADADQLLAAMHKKSADAARMLTASSQKVVGCKKWLGQVSQQRGIINILLCSTCGVTWADASASSTPSAQCPRCLCPGRRTGDIKLADLQGILQKG